MTTLTIEVPDELMAQLVGDDRPVQEVVVSALEKALGYKPAELLPEPSKEEIVRRLMEVGLVREPSELDLPEAREWEDLPEDEKEQHLKEVAEMYFPDSPASRAVIRGRIRLDEGLSRAEMVKRLVRSGIARNPKEWDTLSARQWRKLSAAEKQRFIDETRLVKFKGSPASSAISANRR
ncbi:MAG: hypothetical protein KJZ86_00655 [Caldilineaceae bacterium]|nr:hypothetical protein [Caldilineaceae bacterium]HRJ43083.1 hypothetical protein [Caldilineaceae bacterium]